MVEVHHGRRSFVIVVWGRHRGPLSLVLVAVAPPQQQSNYKSNADRNQERLAGIGSDVAAHLIGDLAKIGVFDLLAYAVVLVLDSIGGGCVLVADKLFRAAE